MHFKIAELGTKLLDNIFAKHPNNTPSNVFLGRLDTHAFTSVFSPLQLPRRVTYN